GADASNGWAQSVGWSSTPWVCCWARRGCCSLPCERGRRPGPSTCIHERHSDPPARGWASLPRQGSMNRKLGFAAVAAIACGALGAADRAQLTVTPGSGLIDAPFHVQVRNVLPGARVTVSASRPDARGRTWTAVGEYAADAS